MMCKTTINFRASEVYSTQGADALSSNQCTIGPDLAPCNHEEADSRLFLCALHCAKQGQTRVLLRTVDTDGVVVIITIAMFHSLHIEELWIVFWNEEAYTSQCMQ